MSHWLCQFRCFLMTWTNKTQLFTINMQGKHFYFKGGFTLCRYSSLPHTKNPPKQLDYSCASQSIIPCDNWPILCPDLAWASAFLLCGWRTFSCMTGGMVFPLFFCLIKLEKRDNRANLRKLEYHFPNQTVKHLGMETGDSVQKLKSLLALPEDGGSITSPHVKQLWESNTLSFGLYRHLYSCIHKNKRDRYILKNNSLKIVVLLQQQWLLTPAIRRQRQADLYVFQSQSSLQNEFQNSRGSKEKPCLQKWNKYASKQIKIMVLSGW